MLERLVPGDQVMCIPTESDYGYKIGVPYGACGEIIEGEAEHQGLNYDGTSVKKLCCVVRFENYICQFHSSGNWLRERPGLMKITPDEKMKEEENAECLKS